MDTVLIKDKIILFRELSREELIDVVEKLYKETVKLRDQLSLNSKNSSKSPSTDINKPNPKSSRKKSNKNPGGQEGHEGTTLEKSENPDEIVKHQVEHCSNCAHALSDVSASAQDSRQEIDIIPAKKIIREHITYSKLCPNCHHVNLASFPAGLDKSIQYGKTIKAKSIYYNERQLIPYARVKELMKDEYGLNISTGTLVNFKKECHEKASFPVSKIKQRIIGSKVCGFDETGVKINGKLNWMHTASNSTLTYFEVHPRRGMKGIESARIFQNFSGKAIHDHWKWYFNNKNCEHGLCNAHHLRELTFAEERYDQTWSVNMKAHLTNINDQIQVLKESGMTKFDKKTLKAYSSKYSKILRDGIKGLPTLSNNEKQSCRKNPKKHKIENLHDRLQGFKKEALAFMYDFTIPFTNNQTERDHRMEKVKQKISGGHRSRKGAKFSCRIRSYLSTALKNGVNAMEALVGIFEGNPFVPA
jgi:transposase